MGRVSKARADLCLLAGSPRDAFEHYKQTSELAKVRGEGAACDWPCTPALRQRHLPAQTLRAYYGLTYHVN